MGDKQNVYRKILDVREKETEQAKMKMAQAIQQQDTVQQKMVHTQQSMEHLQSHLEQKKDQGISVHELQWFETQMSMLRTKMRQQQHELQRAEKNVNHQQQSVQVRKREENKWGHLLEQKEHAQAAWEKNQEQKQLDEIATQSYYRTTNE